MMRKRWFQLPDELAFLESGRLPQKRAVESMKGKICLITGATSGVGYQGAWHLARAGADLIFISRSQEKAEALTKSLVEKTGVKVFSYIADFTKLDEVERVCKQISANHQRIDVLINCAGVHMTTRRLTPGGHETSFCVNHLASFLITAMLLERLIENAPSRIIQVNSEGHRFNGLNINDLNWEKRKHLYRGILGYGASKTAQLMTVWEFNDLLKDTGVTINAMHPGAVKSNIGMNNGWLYRTYSKYFVSLFLKNPDIAGNAIHYLASAPELQKVSGKFFNLTNEEIPAPHSRNREIGKKVFNLSKELTGLQDEPRLKL